MANILIVEDEKNMQDIIAEYMQRDSHTCFTADDGVDALMILKNNPMDLMILDIMMPHLDGFSVCKMAREMSSLPIIMLTAKESEYDKLKGYDLGADDYMTKPFHIRELLARIFVQLKNSDGAPCASVLSYDDITLHTDTHMVNVKDTGIKLTRTEFAILKLLMQNPSQVITKSILLDRISEDTPDCTENSLKMHISNLRKKLREVTGRDYIEAVWGIGFKMRQG